jgi:pilus assembly protein Flp/PilA
MTGFTAGSMRRIVRRFCDDQEGATAIEYALIAAGVGMAVASTVFTLGSNLKSTWWDKVAAIFG